MKTLFLALLMLSLGACAITNESTLIIGEKREATVSENVVIYTATPEKYQEIAIVTADAAHDFMSKQALLDIAVQNLKEEAAKVGANGILLEDVGNFNVGASGIMTIPNSNSSGVAIAATNTRTGKQISGKAIFVYQ